MCSLVGYSPWGRKESDTIEQLHFHFQRLINCAPPVLQGFFIQVFSASPPNVILVFQTIFLNETLIIRAPLGTPGSSLASSHLMGQEPISNHQTEVGQSASEGPTFLQDSGRECVLFMPVTLTGTKIDSVNCDLYWKYKLIWGFPGSASGKKKKERKTNPPANKGDTRDMCSTPGLGRYPEGGNGNPLQYSCLENLVDRRVWWVTVHRVIKNRALLKGLSMHACINLYEVCNMAVF